MRILKYLLFVTLIFLPVAFRMSPAFGEEKKPEQDKKAVKEAQKRKVSDLPAAYKNWLDEVHWIISDYEKEAFLSIDKDEDRDRFIKLFWENRDPTPGTEKNEFKEEHYARYAYANKYYGRESPMPGWKTDRGRVYILLGKPEFIRKEHGSFELNPMELWQYARYKGYGLPGSLYFIFFQEKGAGGYRLYSPLQDGVAALFNSQKANVNQTEEYLLEHLRTTISPDIAYAAVSSIPTEGGDPRQFTTGTISTEVVFAKLQNARNYDLRKRKYVDDFIHDRPTVQVYTSIDSGGIRDGVYWFEAPNGHFYIDYAIEFEPDKLDMGSYDDYYTSLTIDGSIATPEKVMVDEIAGSHEIRLNPQQFGQIKNLPFQYQGRKPIAPGKFGATLIINNNVSRRSITFVHDIEIPDLETATTPYITPVLPIRNVEAALDQGKKIRPFQFEDKVFTPNLPAKYAVGGMLKVYHQVIFPVKFEVPAAGLELKYLIYKGDQVEREAVEPLHVSAEDLVGNAVGIQKEVPLASLSFGEKKLIVELRHLDKVITRSPALSFSVEPEVHQGVWKYSVGLPLYDSPYHDFTLAQQLIRLKKPEEAFALMEEAHKKNPDSLEIRLQLMRAALKAANYSKVLELGNPAEVKNPRNKDLLWLMGWAFYSQEKFPDAVRFFERLRMEDSNKIEVLNLLADIYYRMDERSKSLERLKQSIALKPDQKDLLELKKRIESNQ